MNARFNVLICATIVATYWSVMAHAQVSSKDPGLSGAVYTMTNGAAENSILVYSRNSNGLLAKKLPSSTLAGVSEVHMAGAIRRWQRYLMAKSRALDLSELLNPTNGSMIRQNSNRGAILFRLWDRLAGTRNLFQNEDESLFRAISRYTGKAREQLSHQS